MNWGNLRHFLEKITIPLAAPGIGMQAPLGTRPRLSENAVELVRSLASRCRTLGVRGYITAQMLYDLGIDNLRIVGCPSAFRSLKPTWGLDQARLGRIRSLPLSQLNIAVTLRREIGPDYVRDIPRYLAIQKALIKEFFSTSNLQLFAQGELFEKYFYAGRTDLYEPLYDELVETGWISDREDEIFEIYRRALFFSSDIPLFLKQLATADLTTGFRVHGVLPSLAQGIPGVLVDYDNRTHELIDTFSIPSVAMEAVQSARIIGVAKEYDYSKISRQYEHHWAEMKAFMDENDIPHRMDEGPPLGPEQPVRIVRVADMRQSKAP